MSDSKCILVVDDDQTTVMLTRLFLESLSLTDVHSSSNGQEAIDFIKERCRNSGDGNCPEIVLLDLNMPVMDGFEFLEAFAEVENPSKEQISIVVLTSSDNKRDRERIEQSSVDVSGYIVKPLTKEKIKPFLA